MIQGRPGLSTGSVRRFSRRGHWFPFHASVSLFFWRTLNTMILFNYSLRKRTPMHGSHYPPPALRAIWTPLLENLAVGTLRTALSSHILARLLAERACPDEEGEDGERASHERCLAAWGAWLVDWRLGNETDADVSARREDVFFQLIHALCTSCPCPQRCDEEQIPLGCQPGCVFPTATRARFFFLNISPPPTHSLLFF